MGGARLGDPIGTVIVDSGTSFMYLPPSAYAAVRDHWRSHCPWGDCRARDAAGQYPDDYCYRMDQPTLARFDELSLHFGGGVTLPFGPLDYAYELYQGVWCLGIFDNERRGGWLKMPSTRLTAPPHPPAWYLKRHRPLLRTPERRLSGLDARRGLRSPPQPAAKMRTLPQLQPTGAAASWARATCATTR